MNTRRIVCVCGVAAALGAVLPEAGSRAEPGYLSAWQTKYPNSTLSQRMALVGSACFVCHNPPNTGTIGTCYKNDIRLRLNAGATIQQALNDVDALDSDQDGAANGVEINLVRHDNPAERGYHPGLVGPTGTSPCGPNPATPVTNVPETPPCYPDCNADGALTVADFGCFQTRFVSGNVYADCNADGVLTVADFGCFQTKFVAGCP